MRFNNDTYLYLLLAIPVLTLLMAMATVQRRRMLRRLGDMKLVKALQPSLSMPRRWWRFGLMMAAIAMLVVAVARPQMGSKVNTDKRTGIEAIIALDISNSMLAQDVKPSRLDKSKMLIETLTDKFTTDKVGVLVFAGDAFVQIPITSDYVSARMFLQNIDPSLISAQGTDIAAAINLASKSFTQQKNVGKAIILITDGEDHEGGATEAAEQARKAGYRVFVLGVGSEQGAPVPMAGGGYITDNTGNTVMSRLNQQMCREVAKAGGGSYIHVDNTTSAQEALSREIGKMQKSTLETVVYSEYDEKYQIFAALALLLLIIEAMTSESINPWLNRLRLFSRSRVGVLVIALLMPATMLMAQSDRGHIRQGNRQFRQQSEESVKKAEVSYQKAEAANNANAQAIYNRACAMLAQNKDSLAMDAFGKSAKLETSPRRRAMSYRNMGVIMQKHRQYDKAIEQYKQSLRLNPSDDEARYNLVLCQRLKKDQPNSQGGGGGNDKNKDKVKQNKDQQNKQDQQNKDQDKQDKQDQQGQQPKEGEMSRENAEQLLNAAMQEEKATQERMKKAMQRKGPRSNQKNW